MRVLVLSSMVPFSHDMTEELPQVLVRNLEEAGFEAEAFRIPFTPRPAERLVTEMMIARRLRVLNVDRVIVLTFPLYLVAWHDKIVWLNSVHTPAYEPFDAGQSDIPSDCRGRQIVNAVRAADVLALSEAKAVYTQQPTTSRRLLEYTGIESSLLRPPPDLSEVVYSDEGGEYILAAGEICATNRQHLLIRALRHAPGAHLVIAGTPNDSGYTDLLQVIAEEAVEDRVTLEIRYLSRSDLSQLISRALAVAYLPSAEQVPGCCLIAMAFGAGKPVLTTTDLLDGLDLVRDNETGLVTAPHPEALGKAMAALTGDPKRAIQLGHAAKSALDDARWSWPEAIFKLLA